MDADFRLSQNHKRAVGQMPVVARRMIAARHLFRLSCDMRFDLGKGNKAAALARAILAGLRAACRETTEQLNPAQEEVEFIAWNHERPLDEILKLAATTACCELPDRIEELVGDVCEDADVLGIHKSRDLVSAIKTDVDTVGSHRQNGCLDMSKDHGYLFHGLWWNPPPSWYHTATRNRPVSVHCPHGTHTPTDRESSRSRVSWTAFRPTG